MLVNIYAPNKGAPNYIKQILIIKQGDTENTKIRQGNLTPCVHRWRHHPDSKSTRKHWPQIPYHSRRTLYISCKTKPAKYRFFQVHIVHAPGQRNLLGHKTSLNKFKETEITSSIIFDQNSMKLETTRRKLETYQRRINSVLLNNQWVRGEIKGESLKNTMKQIKMEPHWPAPGGSVGWSIILYIKRWWVRSPVMTHAQVVGSMPLRVYMEGSRCFPPTSMSVCLSVSLSLSFSLSHSPSLPPSLSLPLSLKSTNISSGQDFKKKKMSRGPEYTFFQRRYTDGQQKHEKMLNTTNHQGNENQNQKILPHTCQNINYQTDSKEQVLVRMFRTENKHLCRVGGPVNSCSHYEQLCKSSSKIKTRIPYDPSILILAI